MLKNLSFSTNEHILSVPQFAHLWNGRHNCHLTLLQSWCEALVRQCPCHTLKVYISWNFAWGYYYPSNLLILCLISVALLDMPKMDEHFVEQYRRPVVCGLCCLKAQLKPRCETSSLGSIAQQLRMRAFSVRESWRSLGQVTSLSCLMTPFLWKYPCSPIT